VGRGIGALVLAFSLLGVTTTAASDYRVKSGDTLWGISRWSGVSVDNLVRDNSIPNPDLIYPGQVLTLPDPQPAPIQAPAPAPAPAPAASARTEVSPALAAALSHAGARSLLIDAARRHGLKPSFMLAVAMWESGWRQDVTSNAGAVGLMQITPATADWAGPRLLGRRVDLNSSSDNADLGAALLRYYLELFDDRELALAAYYQGPTSAGRDGILPVSRPYIDGIWALRNRFEAGEI
jgi:soluble lytic murein transglycosylase-like protein